MRDPQGVYFGGNEMVMTPRQMLAFGELYRNGGQRRRPADSLEGVHRRHFRAARALGISGREYGYGWWIREMAGEQTYYAWGFGGQYIVLVPEPRPHVVSTSAATVSEDRREHRRTVDEIIEQLIIASLKLTTGPAPVVTEFQKIKRIPKKNTNLLISGLL